MSFICTLYIYYITYRIFGAFTMESILSTAFGRVIDVQNGKSNVMTEAAVVVFSATQENRITSRENLTLLISKFIVCCVIAT